MSKFKIGDRVKCVDAPSWSALTENEIYTVLERVFKCDGKEEDYIVVYDTVEILASRFQLVEEPQAIDWSKPLQTKSGNPFELFSSCARGNYPVVGYVSDHENLTSYTTDGYYVGHNVLHPLDLQNVPEKATTVARYVNVCKHAGKLVAGELHPTREAADIWKDENRVSCMKMEVTLVEGQFDE
jgi:hypothetical protein